MSQFYVLFRTTTDPEPDIDDYPEPDKNEELEVDIVLGG